MTIWTIVIVSLFVISLLIHRSIKCPVVFLLLLWSIIFLLSTINSSEFYLSEIPWKMVGISLIAFFVGFELRSIFRANLISAVPSYSFFHEKLTHNNRILLFVYRITAIFALFSVVAAINAITKGLGLYDIRYNDNVLLSYGILPFNLSYLASIFLVKPITILSIPVAFLSLKRSSKISGYRYLLYSLFFIITEIISTGGRFVVAFVGLSLLLCLGLRKKDISFLNKRIKRIFRVVITMVPLVLIAITINRSGDINHFFESIYSYLTGCMPLFSVLINEVPTSSGGFSSFYGVLYPFFFILKQLHVISDYPMGIQLATDIMNRVQLGAMISPSSGYNAFVSPAYHLYIDGGIILVVFGSLFWGILSSHIYIKALTINDIWHWTTYIVIMIGIFLSIQNYPFVDISWTLSLVYSLLLSNRPKISIKIGRRTKNEVLQNNHL